MAVTDITTTPVDELTYDDEVAIVYAVVQDGFDYMRDNLAGALGEMDASLAFYIAEFLQDEADAVINVAAALQMNALLRAFAASEPDADGNGPSEETLDA